MTDIIIDPMDRPKREAVLFVRIQGKSKNFLEREAQNLNLTVAEFVDEVVKRLEAEKRARNKTKYKKRS